MTFGDGENTFYPLVSLGIAAQEINGKRWHITWKTPQAMAERGFNYKGTINPKAVPHPDNGPVYQQTPVRNQGKYNGSKVTDK